MDIKNKLKNSLIESDRKVLYSAIVLDSESHNKLVKDFLTPEGWKIFAHHLTIAFGKSLQSIGLGDFDGKSVELIVKELGDSDFAIAVKCEVKCSEIAGKIENKIPHITLYINVARGGKPVMSNDIVNWTKLESPFIITGIVSNIYK